MLQTERHLPTRWRHVIKIELKMFSRLVVVDLCEVKKQVGQLSGRAPAKPPTAGAAAQLAQGGVRNDTVFILNLLVSRLSRPHHTIFLMQGEEHTGQVPGKA